MPNLICKLFGHRWKARKPFWKRWPVLGYPFKAGGHTRQCRRCGCVSAIITNAEEI